MPRKPVIPQAMLSIMINGVLLEGKKKRGLWTFECSRFPDLVKKYHHSQDDTGIMSEFMQRCLSKAIVVEYFK